MQILDYLRYALIVVGILAYTGFIGWTVWLAFYKLDEDMLP